jgi:hypothetical protein
MILIEVATVACAGALAPIIMAAAIALPTSTLIEDFILNCPIIGASARTKR